MAKQKVGHGRRKPLRKLSFLERQELDREQRLWHDFQWYTQRMLVRLRMTDCLVTAKRHDGDITELDYQVVGGDDEPAESSDAVSPVAAYTPAHCRRQLRLRLARLTKDCTIEFGRILVFAEAGQIHLIHFNEFLRPEEGGERHFRSA